MRGLGPEVLVAFFAGAVCALALALWMVVARARLFRSVFWVALVAVVVAAWALGWWPSGSGGGPGEAVGAGDGW